VAEANDLLIFGIVVEIIDRLLGGKLDDGIHGARVPFYGFGIDLHGEDPGAMFLQQGADLRRVLVEGVEVVDVVGIDYKY